MQNVDKLESSLNEIFVKKAPELPAGGKKFLVSIAAVVSLIIGVLTLLSAWSLWHWGHATANVSSYAAQLCNAYGNGANCGVSTSRFSLWLWLAIVFLLVEGVVYLLAYPGLRDRTKAGWNYLFYGALINVVYAIVSLFTSYDAAGHFIGGLIGSAIAFYLLFQMRASYLAKNSSTPPTTPEAK